MHVFSVVDEQEFNPKRHVEKILGRVAAGDVTVACWEPGQISPYHCHPQATEIYFCFEGGGVMRTPEQTIDVTPGSFVVHPPGELHEYANGPQRTLLFRVRYGDDMASRFIDWRGNADWQQSTEDADYFRQHPATPDAGDHCSRPRRFSIWRRRPHPRSIRNQPGPRARCRALPALGDPIENSTDPFPEGGANSASRAAPRTRR